MKSKAGLLVLTALVYCGVVAAQEYEGPTVLSRGGGGIRPYGARVGEDAKMRIFVGANAIYDYGYLPISTNSAGSAAGFGGQIGYEGKVGIYGTKRWRRSSLGLDYTGSYRGYTKNTSLNGSDHFLGVEYGNQLNRRSLLTGTLTAGTSNRVFGFSGNLIGSPLGNLLPTADIFDARTYFLNGGMGVSTQLTSRLGFELRADAFRVERHSNSLISVEGYSPKASVSYRLNKRQTIGGIYNFYHYDYARVFGETNVQVAMAYWALELNRLWRIETQGGMFIADTAGTRTVAADPIVQQLLGVKTVSESFSRVVALPNANLRVLGKTGNSTFTLGVSRGVGSGNGVTLAATETSGSLSYNYVLTRSLTFGLQGTYSGSAGLANTADRYTTTSGGFVIDYSSPNLISYNFAGQYRHSDSKIINTFTHDTFQLSLGLGWNFRDIPYFR